MILGGIFDLEEKKNRIKELEEEQTKENFWQNVDRANEVNKELSNLKKELNLYSDLNKQINEGLELLNSDVDNDIILLISEELSTLSSKINDLETAVTLNGEFDSLNVYLEIHPGAGGTESCDWASMLERMYQRFCEKYNYKWEIIDEQNGEEAGIKSVTLKISGDYAYGYLKNETGVHRLVRISPFDAGARRHTSFASVSIMPEIKKEINIEIKESDLKIDVYHSSGAGGQSVNTSNSAVRITHIPTKTVVTCQNERSQLNNKEQAMKMLKNKLYMIELEKERQKTNELKGESSSINFGSQIRSYILEPYKMVKDHRTNYQNNEPEKILDGNIMDMLVYNLKELK
ncbi:peptide chain release factor 2 [Clostridium sp. CAG:609]|nr:peptide chain release factor 2 [Clostridium sp. CAG:609]